MIDIIKKIENLRKERGWSVNYLATEAMLTQSTLSSMYKRNTPPKIDTIQSICDAFGITLSQFFSDEDKIKDLSTDETELIHLYRQLSPAKQKAIKTLIKKQ